MKQKKYLPILILAAFLVVGLMVYKDYGPSADEHIVIDSGHVVWKYICEKLHRPVPEQFADLPEIHEFKNSFYGQAATFPTVLIEALQGFRMDSSTVIRLRHLWNFLTYFAALCCFAAVLQHLSGDGRLAALGLLFMILLPRIFGDIFYNDRDLMLLSWMLFSCSAFYLFTQRPGWGTALLAAAVFGVTFNTRIFGLTLLVFPGLYFLFSKKRKYIFLLVPAALIIWGLVSPVAWDDPIRTIPDAFRHFSTQQRYLDTGNEAHLLFFGRSINETELPWYYLPMYIVVSTPLMTLLSAAAGAVAFFRRLKAGKRDIRSLFGAGMLIILIVVPLVGIIFGLTFYNGWRHFYFLNLPIVCLALEGSCLIWETRRTIVRVISCLLLSASFVMSGGWIASAHPYQSIYLNPVFRSRWIGKFDRDYWILSTTECMKYLLENAPETALNVVDKQTFIEYTIIGLQPHERERFHTMYHSAQPIPFEYLFFNYSNMLGNEQSFDYYTPVYAIERDGIKLAEVFQRSHNDELRTAEVVEAVSPAGAAAIADGDFGTPVYGNELNEIILELKDVYRLSSVEIFPAEGSAPFEDVHVSVSDDGTVWTALACTPKGANGTAFPETEARFIKLESSVGSAGIRDILLYGRDRGPGRSGAALGALQSSAG